MAGRLVSFLRRTALDRPDARAWAMYDWANSAMVTTVITAIFPVYYVRVVSQGLERSVASSLYSRATVWSLVFIALLAPFLGVLADLRSGKKAFLGGFTLAGCLAVAGLFFVQHGDWKLALVLFGLANVGAAGGVVFYDSLLPHVAPPGKMDQLSTSGYALGYVGGGLVLALNLAWLEHPAWFGLPHGDGLTPAQETLPARLAFLSVAIWWAVFTLPLLRRVPEPAVPRSARSGPLLRTTFGRLAETFGELRQYRQALRMLVAFLIYNDGIATVIRMAALYATSRELDDSVVVGTVLAVQFVGIPFAFLFGRLAERFHARRMIVVGLVVYTGICVFAYFMTTNLHFVLLGLLVATAQGGTQGLSRSLFGAMVPRTKSAEFFSFFAVGEKFAGILGPLLFLLVIELTGSDQNAILAISVFFLIGGALLLTVDVEEGRRAALAEDQEVLAGQST